MTDEIKKFLDLSGLTYYNDKVKSKINTTKVALENSIAIEQTARVNADNSLTDRINQLASGSPIPVNSVSDMTDTTRIYVNTADGDWYYWDGDSWTSGGTYQSTGIGVNTIEPYMTKYLASKNILPYTNWVEGKVWNWVNGSEMVYVNGCLNYAEIPVTAGETLLIINNNLLTMNDISVTEYTSSDVFVKNTRVGYGNYTSRITIDNNTSYIKFSSITNKFSTLPVNSMMIIRLSDVDDIANFNSIFDYSSEFKPSVKSDEIVVVNKYGQKLIPRLYRNAYIALDINNLSFPNPYTFQYSGLVSGTGATAAVLLGCYIYADNVTTNDYLYVDYTNSTVKPDYVSLVVGTTSQGYMTKIDETNGIWRTKITDTIIGGLNTANIYFYATYSAFPTGQTLVADANCYINENYSDIIDYVKTNDTTEPVKTMFLGDSITHLGGDRAWTTKFNNLINGETVANVAVDGAHLKDYENTVYDGNPTDTVQANNVLGNQVQKIINNNYDAPDAILIAIGTNGGIEVSGTELYDAFFANNAVKPITDVNRQTDAGAYRYCTEKLHDLYPNAKIIWCTPILGAASNKWPNIIKPWGDNLKEFCAWGSTYCFDTEKCGINSINANEYLADGLHPNAAGAQLMADYNAAEFYKIAKIITSK